MVTKARQLAEFIANADVDSDEIATGAVSASKLADTLDLSSKTIVMPDVAAFNITSGDRVGIKNSGTDISGTSLDDLVVGAGTTLAGMVLDGGASNDTAYGFANAGTKVGRIQYINSSNNMVFQTNNANRMVIDGSGNVGIGTTSPDYLMHLYKGGSTLLKLQSTTATSLVNFINSGGSATIVSQNNILNLQTDNTTRMHLDASGNVGIGTTTPWNSLSIGGGTYPTVALGSDANEMVYLQRNKVNGGDGYLYNKGSGSLILGTDNTRRITINSSGNVGIGTSSPATPLDVTKAGGGNFVATFQNTTSATPYGVWIKEPSSASNGYPSLQVTDNAGTTTRFRVDSGTGNVGIGQGAAAVKLHIGNGTGTSPHMFLDGVFGTTAKADHSRIYFGDYNFGIGAGGWGGTSNDDLYIWAYGGTGRDIRFATTTNGNTDVTDAAWSTNMIIQANGNVGIGTTDPSYAKLHIINNVSGGSNNFMLMLQNTTTVADSRSGIMFSTNSGQGAGRDGAAIQASNNGVDGKAHITFGNVINNTFEEKVRFTTDGYVTTPYQPAFKAGLSANTSVTSLTAIPFNTTSGDGRHNIGGHYNTSNGRFTAPVAGTYHFDVGLLYGPSIPNGTNFDDAAFLYLNGSLVAYDERRGEYVDGTTGNGGYYGTWIHNQLYMNSGDYVEVINYNRFSGIHGNSKFTWFAGFLIG